MSRQYTPSPLWRHSWTVNTHPHTFFSTFPSLSSLSLFFFWCNAFLTSAKNVMASVLTAVLHHLINGNKQTRRFFLASIQKVILVNLYQSDSWSYWHFDRSSTVELRVKVQFAIIIIMEFCKVPTLRLKALNKHTHIMYIEMENVIQKKKEREKILTRVFKHYARYTLTHTHTVQTDRSEGQCSLTQIFWAERAGRTVKV